MKRRSQIFSGLCATILAIITILLSLGGLAYCQSAEPVPSTSSGQALSSSEGVSLLLEQIPAQGGTITPNVGIYHLKPNSEITLTANPKPGYQFICWLGDVSDPKASSTVAYINGPKIIIALFERNENEGLLPLISTSGGGVSGAAGLAGGGSAPNFANPSGLMIGGGGKAKPKVFSPAPPSIPWSIEPPTFLAPVQEDPIVPEPATGILLALGGLFTFIRRQKSEDRRQK